MGESGDEKLHEFDYIISSLCLYSRSCSLVAIVHTRNDPWMLFQGAYYHSVLSLVEPTVSRDTPFLLHLLPFQILPSLQTRRQT
jgi:hypothetical protein